MVVLLLEGRGNVCCSWWVNGLVNGREKGGEVNECVTREKDGRS